MWWNDVVSMVPHSTIRRVLLPLLAAPSIPQALLSRLCPEIASHYRGSHFFRPLQNTLPQDSLQDSLFTDRVLIISCEGKRWVYPYFIRNTEASAIMFKEDLAAGEDGITLNYEAGNGWKYTYNTTIGMRFGRPCLLQLSVFEHSSGAEYQSVRDFNFENGEKCFPVSRYRRDFPMLLRAGDIDKFYVD